MTDFTSSVGSIFVSLEQNTARLFVSQWTCSGLKAILLDAMNAKRTNSAGPDKYIVTLTCVYSRSPVAETTEKTQVTLSQCCFNVGPASQTMAQHLNSIGHSLVFADKIGLEKGHGKIVVGWARDGIGRGRNRRGME